MTTQAQTSIDTDDSQIRDLIMTMEMGWTNKDGNLFAKPFTENADYVIINGLRIKGRTAIADGHQRIFDSFYKQTFIQTVVQSIRFLRPDIAVVHVNSSMTGTSNGHDVDTKAIISLTVEKTTAGWQIASFQNTAVEVQENRPSNN